MENPITNFTEMMSGSLGVIEPWYISHAEFDKNEPALHIYVKVHKNAAIACPACGGVAKRYGYEKNERIWRHGDCMFYPCYVHCRRPKILCDKCGTKQVNAPFERKNSRFTLFFEGYVMLILPDMPVSKTAELVRCDEKSITSILRYWVNKAVDGMSLEKVSQLAIDETSFKRGHKYVTLIIDAAKRCVIDVEEGRDIGAVELFADKFVTKGGNTDNIKAVTSDMSKSYLSAAAKRFPKAEHTIDKFHVKQVLTKALDDVRRSEQHETNDKKTLFQGRRLFMIPESKLSPKQAANITEMSKLYPKTGRAYRIVSALDDFLRKQDIRRRRNRLYRALFMDAPMSLATHEGCCRNALKA